MPATIQQRIAFALAKIPQAEPTKVPTVFYTGTSSKFLRSIMVYGLDPSKIKEGNWTQDDNTNQINPSKKSYGGIYFSKDASKALTYADSLVRKQDGEGFSPLLVAVQLTEASSQHDEDDYMFVRMIFSSINNGNHENSIAENLVQILMHYETDYYGGKWTYKTVRDKFRNTILEHMYTMDPAFKEHVEKRADQAELFRVIDALFVAEAKRFLSHLTKKNGYNSWSNGKYLMTDAFHRYATKKVQEENTKTNDEGEYARTAPPEYNLPEPADAEADFINTLDRFVKMTKGYDPQRGRDPSSFSNSRRTLRMLTPVRFKGANKIICILQLPYRDYRHLNDNINIKIIYGKVPSTFLASYHQNIIGLDKPVYWQDKMGNPLYRDEPLSTMTVAYDLDEPFAADGVDVDDTENGSAQDKYFEQIQELEDERDAAKQAAEQKANPQPQQQEQEEGDDEDSDGDSGSDNESDEDDSDDADNDGSAGDNQEDDASDDDKSAGYDDDSEDDEDGDDNQEQAPPANKSKQPPPPPAKGKQPKQLQKKSAKQDDDTEDDDDSGRNADSDNAEEGDDSKSGDDESDESDDDNGDNDKRKGNAKGAKSEALLLNALSLAGFIS